MEEQVRPQVLRPSPDPFGPIWFDRLLAFAFGLRGDFVPDFRLIDYPVALMSTDRSPALDGTLGNTDRLKSDLTDLGIFDARMSMYLPFRLRTAAVMGFSGFEGRQYSVFERFEDDMGPAADLQNLVVALAYKYVALGQVSHQHIPDDPCLESERRQIFFGAAIGLPTFYVRRDSPNAFLRRIVEGTRGVRHSHRYQGYLRVRNRDCQKSLVAILKEDATDLIEAMRLRGVIRDLENRLDHPAECSAAGRLTRGILDVAGERAPLDADAHTFNRAAETYYRGTLRQQHLRQAFEILTGECRRIETEDSQSLGAILDQAISRLSSSVRPHRCARKRFPSRISAA